MTTLSTEQNAIHIQEEKDGDQVSSLSTWLFTKETQHYNPSSSTDLIAVLKNYGLWNIKNNAIYPFLINSFPNDLNDLDVKQKKKVFFYSMLPAALMAQQEVDRERKQLNSIITLIGIKATDLIFSENISSWKMNLSLNQIEFVKKTTKKYQTNNGAELLKRVQKVPISLILAQSALESSWGTSRFANEANNLFGMWTWGPKGIIPLDRDEGKNHKIAIYNSILDSIRAYILTINRFPAYSQFRNIRAQSMNSVQLCEGLLYYSERREKYVAELQQVIRYNNLQRFDTLRLTAPDNSYTLAFSL